ncbi:MAG TPA: hypothetical protein VF092_10140 [Longimicrobium sp.]
MKIVRLLAASALVLTASAARAQGSTVRADSAAFAGAVVFRLRNGPNPLDIVGNGGGGMVFVAWRENYNAHGYAQVAFYARGRSIPEDSVLWQLVPFFGGERGFDVAQTHMGADCVLVDLRVVRPRRGGPVAVVVGEREHGDSYIAEETVRFHVYRLETNRDGVPGWPLHRFEHQRTITPTRRYCDINEAFRRELGLGAHGAVAAEFGSAEAEER